MQCLDRQVPIWDIFTEEEILAWAEIENYKYFAQKGPEPVSHGRSWGLASRTLRHLLDESAEDLVAQASWYQSQLRTRWRSDGHLDQFGKPGRGRGRL